MKKPESGNKGKAGRKPTKYEGMSHKTVKDSTFMGKGTKRKKMQGKGLKTTKKKASWGPY